MDVPHGASFAMYNFDLVGFFHLLLGNGILWLMEGLLGGGNCLLSAYGGGASHLIRRLVWKRRLCIIYGRMIDRAMLVLYFASSCTCVSSISVVRLHFHFGP